jgi:Flp pilus assembly protein TadD
MMGTAYDKMYKEDDALKEFLAAEQADPKFPGVHSGLGLLYWKKDQVEKARQEFQQELALFPNDFVSNELMGELSIRQHRDADAVRYLQTAVRINPKYETGWRSLGEAQNALHQPKAAAEALRKAVTLDPNDAKAHFQLGRALIGLGQREAGRKEMAQSTAIQAAQRAAYTRKLNQSQQATPKQP